MRGQGITSCTGRISGIFKNLEVPVLNLGPVLSKYCPKDLVVNSNDAHPNEFVHQITADTLLPFLRKQNLIE